MLPALLWDMDGTLVDSEPLHEEALIAALEVAGLSAPEGFHQMIVGKDAQTIHAWCRDELGLPTPFVEWVRFRFAHYRRVLHRLTPRPGALETFAARRAAGHPSSVVSNSDRMYLDATLDAVGLTTPGMVTVARNDVRTGKPGPEPYLRAAWLLGREPRDCIVIEDSTTGAAAGLAAGMKTIFWPVDDAPAPPGAERARSAADLARLIDEGTR